MIQEGHLSVFKKSNPYLVKYVLIYFVGNALKKHGVPVTFVGNKSVTKVSFYQDEIFKRYDVLKIFLSFLLEAESEENGS